MVDKLPTSTGDRRISEPSTVLPHLGVESNNFEMIHQTLKNTVKAPTLRCNLYQR